MYFLSVYYLFFCLCCSQALRLQWEKEAEHAQSNLKTSLTETQSRLADTQRELASTQASLTQTQTSLSQTHSDLSSIKEQKQKLEQKLKQAVADRDTAARKLHSPSLSPILSFCNGNYLVLQPYNSFSIIVQTDKVASNTAYS